MIDYLLEVLSSNLLLPIPFFQKRYGQFIIGSSNFFRSQQKLLMLHTLISTTITAFMFVWISHRWWMIGFTETLNWLYLHLIYQCLKSVQIRIFFLVRIFPYSDWIRENTDQKKTPYLDTFHEVYFISMTSFYNLLFFMFLESIEQDHWHEKG